MSRHRALIDDDDEGQDEVPQLVPRARLPRAAHRRSASAAEGQEDAPVPPVEPHRHSASQVERGDYVCQ